ncbi:hypothetical protein EDB19DRAFT_1970535 [Suillus lakei]|nr:hypothetical protein EDB19DRAFT_1970535 [Suillus lakei]
MTFCAPKVNLRHCNRFPSTLTSCHPAVENTKAGKLMKDAAMSPGKLEHMFGLPPRSRVGLVAQRAALGWAKRNTGHNGLENKENASIGNISLAAVPGNMSQGLIKT